VSAGSNVTATFSEEMDATTITGSTFTLTAGGSAVPASVTYNAATRVATLNPTADLAASTSYTATVTTGVEDVAGNPMAAPRTWTFTTAAASGGGGGTPETVTLTATEDSYVESGTAAGRNFGTATTLVVDGSPVTQTFLKFDLSPYAGRTLTAATLQLRTAGSGSSGTQNIKLVGVDSWTESGITYNNRPALGATVGSLTRPAVNTNYTVNLTASSLQAELGQILSLGLDSTSTDGVDLASSETTTPPRLVLTFAP
jgi:hypothetical protein